MVFEPILRSPPFPGTPAATAAVSQPKALTSVRATLSAPEIERAHLIIGQIVAERIGGSFWKNGKADPWHGPGDNGPFVSTGDDECGLIAWMAGREVDWSGAGRFADIARDGRPGSIERAVTTWLIDAADYRDPYSGRPVPVEAAIEQLGFWRQAIDRNRGLTVGAGIARWKRREVEAMLWPGEPLHFARSAEDAVRTARATQGAIAVWPSKAPRGLDAEAAAHGVTIHPVEDGFLRSAGLGSDCHPPHSIILDRTGLHLDPNRPSDLENLIATPIENPVLIARAERLMRDVVDAGISKYASGGRPFDRPVQGRRLVLVTGQVEDDLSVQLGGAGVDGNLDLIRRARAAEPDAYLIFKPHPDVDAGHRRGRIADAHAMGYVDQIVRDVPMASLLDSVDAVHVLTSLAGFEALMRGCEVVTHGQPFYAGWGLTRDLAPPIERRRGRNVTKAQLVAATLILYPHYLDPVTKLPCPPEILVERLAAQPVPQETLLTRFRRLQGRLRRGLVGA
ncbi:capsular polysaccharide export protein, LipB/KpsS family [Sphingomonas sp. SRS2]|uniref:capsular polysaccharide export protein, LipB/KpsS family n=1 Tax=Sphingomonas sp. SRS2 TaxID=133190 RepID=UPI00061843C2|nr:capsule biosynthesis protein [Sphingomonas sp. SRS2]KKC27047.1 capsule biosynthesis protein [Sphingomonas sp. SRS2]